MELGRPVFLLVKEMECFGNMGGIWHREVADNFSSPHFNTLTIKSNTRIYLTKINLTHSSPFLALLEFYCFIYM